MPFVEDILRGVQLQIDAFWYSLLLTAAGVHWGAQRAAILAGHTIAQVNEWLTSSAFAPLLDGTAQGLGLLFHLTFVVALFVLGVTYLLAAFVRLQVVEFRSALLWYLAGALFFGGAPNLYNAVNTLRLNLADALYSTTLGGLQAGGALGSLGQTASADGVGILPPCDNFNSGSVNGLDVALAYLRADSIDVLGFGTSCQPHMLSVTGALIASTPTEWEQPSSFFDANLHPRYYENLTDEQRAESLRLASAAHGRLFTAWALVGFGVAEQGVSLLLTAAQGITFMAFGLAILFAFFKKTEVIARSVIDQWIELLVQTAVLALLQALMTACLLAGAASGSGVVVLGVGILCLLFMGIVLWSGVRAVWNSVNRLFSALGQATGGAILTPAQTALGMGAGAAAVLTGGAALGAGAVASGAGALAGMTALRQGATAAQVAGVTLGGSQTLTGAARSLAYLPSVRGTALGEAAEQFAEGAATRSVAAQLPVVGRVVAPLVGAALLSDRRPEADPFDADGQARPRPMLVPAVGQALGGWTTPRGASSPARVPMSGFVEDEAGEPLPLTPVARRMGTFTPDAPPSGERERADAAADLRGEELEQHLSGVLSAPTAGTLRIDGARDVASALADVLRVAPNTPRDALTLSNQLGAVLGVQPVNGQPPVTQDLSRLLLFLNQVERLGISPAGTERLVRGVKASPSGILPPAEVAALTQALTARGFAPDAAQREVGQLQRAAAHLPDALSAYGTFTPPPVQVAVVPNINVQVNSPAPTATTPDYDQTQRQNAALNGSQTLTGGQA